MLSLFNQLKMSACYLTSATMRGASLWPVTWSHFKPDMFVFYLIITVADWLHSNKCPRPDEGKLCGSAHTLRNQRGLHVLWEQPPSKSSAAHTLCTVGTLCPRPLHTTRPPATEPLSRGRRSLIPSEKSHLWNSAPTRTTWPRSFSTAS